MKYTVVDFVINEQEEVRQTVSDLLSAELAEAGYEAFVETEAGLQAYIQNALYDSTLLDAAIKRVPVDAHIDFSVSEMEDQDWNSEWEEAGFEPIHVGERCTIYDARHTDRDAVEAGSEGLNLFIETKQAFGSGTHQTTQMMVASILEHVKEGMSVLDFGCGTGILGIVASKCGAQTVLGYDIDPWSVDNAKHNADLNGVSNMDILLGDTTVLENTEMQFDVILANINRNIVVADMPALCRVMKPGALLMTSGYFECDIAVVSERAESLGLTEVQRQTTDEWSCVVYRK